MNKTFIDLVPGDMIYAFSTKDERITPVVAVKVVRIDDHNEDLPYITLVTESKDENWNNKTFKINKTEAIAYKEVTSYDYATVYYFFSGENAEKRIAKYHKRITELYED